MTFPWLHLLRRAGLAHGGCWLLCLAVAGGASVGHTQTPRVALRIEQLKDPDPQVRFNAITWLGEWSTDPHAIGPLIETFKDKNSQNWQEAAISLGKIGQPAVEPLVSALHEQDPRVQAAATRGLGFTQAPGVVDLLVPLLGSPNFELDRQAIKGLGHTKDVRAIEPLIAFARHAKPYDETDIEDALAELGSSQIALLVRFTNDNDPLVRRHATAALAEIKGEQTVLPLLSALHDTDPTVRRIAVRSLYLRVDARVPLSMTVFLDDPEPELADDAAKSLGLNGDTQSVNTLLLLFKSKYPPIRKRAVQGLSCVAGRDHPDRRIIEPLISAMTDLDETVSRNALFALVSMKDPRAVEPLIASLKDPRPGYPASAVGLLGKTGDSRAVEPLNEIVSKGDPKLREAAIDSLAMLKDTRSIDCLIASLRDSSLRVRRAAEKALGAIGPPAAGPLLQATMDPDPNVRQAAIVGLGRTRDPSAVQPLLKLLEGKDPEARWQACYALRWIKDDPRTLQPLLAALKAKDRQLADFAASTLISVGTPAVEPLIAALQDPDHDVQQRAAFALSIIDDPNAKAALHAAYDARQNEVIVGAHNYFMRSSQRFEDQRLIDAFHEAGDLSMAWDFLKSGNAKLEEVARAWNPGSERKRAPEMNAFFLM